MIVLFLLICFAVIIYAINKIVQQKKASGATAAPTYKPVPQPSAPQVPKRAVPPDKLDGLPIAYKYTNVKLCTIADDAPDFAAIYNHMLHEPVYLQIVHEADNQYDAEALAVMDGQTRIGYIYHKNNEAMHSAISDFIKKGYPIWCDITKMDMGNLIIYLDIVIYCRKNYRNKTKFKLTGTSPEDIQEMLTFSEVGDVVTFDFDCDKDKYYADCSGNIGFVPAGKSQLIEDIGDDYQAEITELDINDNGKYYAAVTVYYN